MFAAGKVMQCGAVPSWWLTGGIAGSDCLAAFCPRDAASYAASLVNLNNPGTNDAFAGNNPSWANGTGWTFDGSSDYLKTSILGQAGVSILAKFSGGNSSPAYRDIVGSTDAVVGGIDFIPNYTGSVLYGSHGAVAATASPGYTSGTIALTPAGIYANGSKVASLTQNWSGVTPYALFIGCVNDHGAFLGAFWPGTITHLAFYSRNLTDAEVSAITNAI